MAGSNRVYAVEPHARSLRLLWDKLYDISDALDAANATIKTQQATIGTLQTTLAKTSKQATQALIAAGTPTPTTPGGGPTGGGGAGGGTDDGLGAQGCAQAGADGHVAPGTSLTAVTAGQIVCGTGNEFPALKAVAVDQATRDANTLELLLRMIWHLNLAGFTAGRQINPSGVISGDKLTVQISGIFRAYDVMQLNVFTAPFTTQMLQVFPAKYLAAAGTPD